MWKINEATTKPHWLELETDNQQRSAYVKQDGCIGYRRYFNGEIPSDDPHEENVDNLHICDIDEEIEYLQNLKRIAVEFFGEDWNG